MIEIKLWTKGKKVKTISINPDHVVTHSPPENFKNGEEYKFSVTLLLSTGKTIRAVFKTSAEAQDWYKMLREKI